MYTSIKVKNYKCFVKENDYQGFDIIRPINVIIGKNNSGKSKLLEALSGIVDGTQESTPFDIRLECILSKNEAQTIFSNLTYNLTDNWVPTSDNSYWQLMGRHLQHQTIIMERKQSESYYQFFVSSEVALQLNKYRTLAEKTLNNPIVTEKFNDYKFIHLRAERDIDKEKIQYDNSMTKYTIESNATGICGLLARMLNDEKGHNERIMGNAGNEVNWKECIEKDFLSILNEVVMPEIRFSRIYTLNNKEGFYEIYLEEDKKGGIKLSDSGSGLKTILAALTLLHIVPRLSGNRKNVFAFEELENNLHPSLERKLLKHIKLYSQRYPEALIFLTTHSNVAIDLFGRDKDAQIVRVCNDGVKSIVETVLSNNAKQQLLDDLGVKASDLLQSNCIIWVEGPSDRIYINKWIKLFSEDKFQEGLHYQIIFYGGALLAHYSAFPDAYEKDLINLFNTNRNTYVVMDSDKKSSSDTLKSRVKNIVKKLPDNNWVTQGREIENYLPVEALKSYFQKSIAFNEYDSFAEVYKQIKNVNTFNKVSFATEIINNKSYTMENLKNSLDLEQQINKLLRFIAKSNTDIC